MPGGRCQCWCDGFENVCKARRLTSRESMVADKILSSFLLDPFLVVSMLGILRSHSVAKEQASGGLEIACEGFKKLKISIQSFPLIAMIQETILLRKRRNYAKMCFSYHCQWDN